MDGIMKKIITALLLLSVSSISYAGGLNALKCKKGFARLGDLRYEVSDKCGQPLQIDKISGDNDITTERATHKVSGWIYSFLYVGGTLKEIKRLKRA